MTHLDANEHANQHSTWMYVRARYSIFEYFVSMFICRMAIQ